MGQVDHLVNSTAMLKHHERADWTGVDPRIQRFAALLIEYMRKQGIPMYTHTALRTASKQLQLFNEGRSKVSGPKAAHTTECAVDIVHGSFHWNMSKTEWEYVGIIGKQIAKKLGI